MAPFTFTARIRNRIHKSTNLTRFVISSLWLCLHLEPCSCCQVAVVNNGIASTGYSTFNIHGAHVHPRFCYNQLNATTNLANMAFWGLERDGTDFNIFWGEIFGACLGSRISKRLSQAYSGYIKETLSPRAALQTHVTLHTRRDGGFLWLCVTSYFHRSKVLKVSSQRLAACWTPHWIVRLERLACLGKKKSVDRQMINHLNV